MRVGRGPGTEGRREDFSDTIKARGIVCGFPLSLVPTQRSGGRKTCFGVKPDSLESRVPKGKPLEQSGRSNGCCSGMRVRFY